MNRYLITGGAGAIGSNLVQSLISQDHDVVVLDDLSSGHRHLVPEGAIFIEGSVSDDAALEKSFETKPDYVIHMAALFANQNSVDHPQTDLDVNGLGTLKIFKKSHDQGVQKVLYVSSSCVYGNKEIMVETDTDFQPDTPYAITKLLGERYAKFWADQFKLDTVSVRLFNTYGPNEYPGPYRNVIPNWFNLALQGKPLVITGTGEETRDFTFVADTVAGILGALHGDTEPGDVFNVAGGRATTIQSLAELINDITNNPGGIEYKPRRDWDHVLNRRGDIEKARRVYGFDPKTELSKGLEITHAWLKSVVNKD